MRRTLARHTLLTAVVATVVSALVTVGVWSFAEDEAHRTAERVARQLAAAVLMPLSRHDLERQDGPGHAQLAEELAPFLASGMIERVKVFALHGDDARIVFSDEPRVEGQVGRMDAAMGGRLRGGEVVVKAVPQDADHRFETSLAGARLEVFFGFRDAGGRDAVLEVYVPVDVPGTTRHAAVVLLPLVLAGLALLAVAMIPLSVSLARRMERDRAEQRAVRHYGLAAAELARRDLAQKLHDGVIPDLAGAGLLLEAIRARGHDGADTVPWQLLDHAHDLVTGEVRQLRTLLTELLPPDPVGADLAAALGDLVHRARAGAALAGPLATEPAVHVEVEGTGAPALSDDTAVLLHRVAGELLRNAFRHAGADTVTVRVAAGAAGFVELTVADDGVGFAPDQRRRHGHIGLLLVQRVVEDGGGRVVVTTGPGAGTTVTVTVPSVGGFPRPAPGLRP